MIFLYILANFAYVYVLGIDKIKTAENDRVGTLLMETILGDRGKFVMAALIMVSTFGCLNGVLTRSPVYYAMAKDRLFFKPAAELNKNNVPC